MSETDKPGIKNIVEFALLAAGEPLDIGELRRLTAGEEGDVREALSALEGDWSGRSIALGAGGGRLAVGKPRGLCGIFAAFAPEKAAASVAPVAGGAGGDCLSAAGDSRRHRAGARRVGVGFAFGDVGGVWLDRGSRPAAKPPAVRPCLGRPKHF